MGGMGDLVQVPTDGGQLAGRLPDCAQLCLWQGCQGSQVGAEQDGGIGRRRQATGSRTRLEQLSVAAREADIKACLPCRPITIVISSSTIGMTMTTTTATATAAATAAADAAATPPATTSIRFCNGSAFIRRMEHELEHALEQRGFREVLSLRG